MLPPFPTRNIPRPGFRFFDSTGIAYRDGDRPRLGESHFRSDPGVALQGVWRPLAGDHTSAVSVDRGCLLVASDGVMGAIWTRCPVEVDVVLELIPEVPGDVPGLNYWAGCFAAVGNDGFGAMVRKHETTTQDITWEGAPRTVMVPVQTAFTIDPGDAAWPATARAVTTSTDLPLPSPSPLLVRLKRKNTGLATSVVQTFVSKDGYGWTLISNDAGVDVSTPTDVGVLVVGTATSSFTAKVRLAGVKFLDPTTDPV